MRIDTKKLNAFTMAEALIVLVMLGIIAAITIPQMKTENFNEKGMITLAEKVVGNLSDSMTKILLDNSVYDDFLRIKYKEGTYFSIEDTDAPTYFGNLLQQKMVKMEKSVDTSDKYFANNLINYKREATSVKLADDYKNLFYAADGTLFGIRTYNSCASTENIANPPNDRGTSAVTNICGSIFFDVNGFKKPNKLGSDQYIIPIDKRGIKLANDNI